MPAKIYWECPSKEAAQFFAAGIEYVNDTAIATISIENIDGKWYAVVADEDEPSENDEDKRQVTPFGVDSDLEKEFEDIQNQLVDIPQKF